MLGHYIDSWLKLLPLFINDALVATNVPFLTQLKFSPPIDQFISDTYPAGRGNLATAFILRICSLLSHAGTLAFVAPQSWWFLKRYTSVRQGMLKSASLRILARLGEKAFESPQAGGELVGLSIVSYSHPTVDNVTWTLDVAEHRDIQHKATGLRQDSLASISQTIQLTNPDCAILFVETKALPRLEEYATALRGVGTGDGIRFVRSYWEVPVLGDDWECHQTTVSSTREFGGMSEVILWEKERGALAELAESVKTLNHAAQNWRRGKPNWGKRGVVVSQMGDLAASLYFGTIYDPNCCAIVPDNQHYVPAMWAMCSSGELLRCVREINQNRKVEVQTILSVPVDISYWQQVASERYGDGLPNPYTSDPTQWLFNSLPKDSDRPLQVAVARLVGYRWPRQTGSSFPDCPALGPDGLEKHADCDGVVTLSPVKGEPPAADRLTALLADAFGADWSAAKLASLLSDAGFAGKTLDDWLRDGFFEQHCELFHQRPFVWHVWDGQRNGFHALVNYHRLAAPNDDGRRTLEKLLYTYLGDWIDRQRADQKANVEGADARLAAAEQLKAELTNILSGEPPYDLFVRWKPLAEQPIGWEPDINDGVRMNIRPFTSAKPLGAKAKGACILRVTPKIKWDKDRGKEPQRAKSDFPWFWGWSPDDPTLTSDFAGGKTFDGVRWNDLHYTTENKRAAREARGVK